MRSWICLTAILLKDRQKTNKNMDSHHTLYVWTEKSTKEKEQQGEEEIKQPRIGHNTWCLCQKNCEEMTTETENLCCIDNRLFIPRLFKVVFNFVVDILVLRLVFFINIYFSLFIFCHNTFWEYFSSMISFLLSVYFHGGLCF